jgi:predicted nucleic acid-binding protein
MDTSAARRGITVITTNARDFARLAEFCPVRWEMR